MEITYEQYEKLKPYLPKQRGNVKIDNFTLINALLYAAERTDGVKTVFLTEFRQHCKKTGLSISMLRFYALTALL